jgi:hypothetical protein
VTILSHRSTLTVCLALTIALGATGATGTTGADRFAGAVIPAAGCPDPPGRIVCVRVVDLTPRFLAFYEAALAEEAEPDRRFELWQEHYGFAATPPTAEGRRMQRRLLDEAWPRYADALDRIQAGAGALEPDPEPILTEVARILGLDSPLQVTLLVFVGGFEDNAFFTVQNGMPTVAVPVEQEPDPRAMTLAHEFTHAVHTELAGLSGAWERSIAQTVISEGLAMRMVERLVPGRDAAEYLGRGSDWAEDAARVRNAILTGIRPHLADDASDTVERFTIGTGPSGLRGEAYYVGWLVVDFLLDSGWTYERLARVPAEEMPRLVDQAIASLLEVRPGAPAR